MSPATPIGSRRSMLVNPFMYSPAARPSRTRAPEAKNTRLVGDDQDLLGHRERVHLADVLGLELADLVAVLLDEVGHLEERRLRSPGVASDQVSS